MTTVTLTTFTDAAPCPRVEVFIDGLPGDVDSLTVYRLADGREHQVRGAVRAATAGSLTRIDFECPFNIAVTYRAEMFGADGLSLGFTEPVALPDVIDGPIPDDDLYPSDFFFPEEGLIGTGLLSAFTWLHNPLDPQGAVRVELAPSTGKSLRRPVPGVVSRPLGRRVGVVLAEPRQGVAGLQFDVHALDLATADKIQALIGGYSTTTTPVICIRPGGFETRLRVPKPLFLSAFDIEEVDVDVAWGGEETIQRMTGDEVAPPVPGLFIPLLTAADINAYYATATALHADNLTGAALNRRYDLAGTASA